jgi:PRTRC genetic system ThiF family protein
MTFSITNEKSRLWLPNQTALLTSTHFHLVLVGVGGTGSHFLSRFMPAVIHDPRVAARIERITLIDADIVERSNVGRQDFELEDIGEFKAQVTAEKLTGIYPFAVSYINERLSQDNILRHFGKYGVNQGLLVVSAVDNRAARSLIYNYCKAQNGYRNAAYWLDAGNDRDSGWVCMGNTADDNLILNELEKDLAEHMLIEYLPYSPEIFPDLVDPRMLKREERELREREAACAVRIEAGEQSLMINQAMAQVMAVMLVNFLKGELRYALSVIGKNGLSVKSQPITNSWLRGVLTSSKKGKIRHKP